MLEFGMPTVTESEEKLPKVLVRLPKTRYNVYRQ